MKGMIRNFISAGLELLKDALFSKNGDYLYRLEGHITEMDFKQGNTAPRLASDLKRLLDEDPTIKDVAVFERVSASSLDRIYYVARGPNRDPSTIVIVSEQIQRQKDGTLSSFRQAVTTFHHYTTGHPSATHLSSLIGAPPPLNDLRPAECIANPEPPSDILARTPHAPGSIDLRSTEAATPR